jgi:outer membrane protein assembly factor BamB
MVKRVFLAVLVSAAAAEAGDWPQWRGPNRDAAAGPGGPSVTWPAELTQTWRAPAGAGQSSPVVSAGTVFLFGREDEMEVARALDLPTGKTLWRQGYRAAYKVYPGAASYGSGPKSTPVVHQGRLYTLGISGILTAFEARDGRVAWQKDFTGRFKATAPPFGTSMSPLVAGGLLVVHAGGHDGGALIAFDPATGAEKWTVEGDGPSYSSPILATFSGQQQLILQVHRKILAIDPASGRTLWTHPFVTPCDQNIVTPLRAGDLIVVSSQDTGTQGIRPARRGAAWVPEVVWHTQEVSMYMSSPVLVSGRVVGLSHRRKGQYFALDPATGAVAWKSEPARGEHAAFVTAEGALLVLEGDGTLLVLPQDAASFSPTRRYRVADSATYAHPVPTDLGILVKDENGLSLYGRVPRSASGAGAPQ